jgi:molecular chaperone GrpE
VAGEPSPTPPAEDAARVEADLDSLLADTQRERDEYLELAQRTKADFENYRKRMTGEVSAAESRGRASLATGLLGPLENLERALAAAGIEPAGEASPEDPLAQGVLLTYRELSNTLERAGVEAYDPVGERFDPAWHEALQTRATEGAEAGTVVEVVQKGFRLDGQVLRAARVVVAE